MILEFPMGPAIAAQSNPTISSTEISTTTNDFHGSTVLNTANAEPNTEAPAEDPSNLELANEITTPPTEEEIPFIDADNQSEDAGRPENSHLTSDNDLGKYSL